MVSISRTNAPKKALVESRDFLQRVLPNWFVMRADILSSTFSSVVIFSYFLFKKSPNLGPSKHRRKLLITFSSVDGADGERFGSSEKESTYVLRLPILDLTRYTVHGRGAKSPKINVLCTDHSIQKSYFHHFLSGLTPRTSDRGVSRFQKSAKMSIQNWSWTDRYYSWTKQFVFFFGSRKIDVSNYP